MHRARRLGIQSNTESTVISLRHEGKLRHLITDEDHNRSYY